VVRPAEIQAVVVLRLAIDHDRGRQRVHRSLVAQHQVVSVAKVEAPGEIDMNADYPLWWDLQVQSGDKKTLARRRGIRDPINTVDLDADGRIFTVHNVANPDKVRAVADGVTHI
jgi:hypothetical protein